ncbi:hypothetical protein [Mahella australiensis]|uniref:Uncharacterized protein n=1 Tax=Mahella australiensis (strain DSM 15567 / CIP 107919 / 50-1 BON) TaxID=697281 RepID=F3ZYK8_MAHA5|nr:hypothetical protein [Mahella australiensis]AEE97776.1 hypothetical protein Mahau_2637 [Mahella australiensis 50-1 BON]
MIKRIHAQGILLRHGIAAAAAFGLLCAVILANYDSLFGNPPDGGTLYAMVEQFLPLTAVILSSSVWSDVEGRRPMLFMSLPFNRAEVVCYRILWPVAAFIVISTAVIAYAGTYVVKLDMSACEMIAYSLPVPLVLTAMASFAAVLAKSAMAGQGATFAWWFIDTMVGRPVIKEIYLFAATNPPDGFNIAINRWTLVIISLALGVAAARLYDSSERLIGET